MKSIIYTLLFIVCGLALSAQIPTNGLVAHYPFNYTLDDTSGNGHHITAATNQSAISFVPGKDTAQAVDLANASLCANMQTGAVFSFNNTAITISFWAYIDSNVITGFNPHALIATANTTSSVASHSIEYQLQSGTSAAYLTCYSYYTTNYSSYSQLDFDISAYLNEWHLYTYTYDRTNAVAGASLYIDGTLAKSQAVSSALFVNSGSDRMRLGAAGAYCPTSSIFDDVLLYDRTLTSTEVNDIYDAQVSICPTIVANINSTGSLSPCEAESTFDVLQVLVTAPATGVNYQWLKDGVAIPSATTFSYSVELVPANSGVYTMQLTTNCDTLITASRTITVRAMPPLPVITANGNVLLSNSGGANCQWFRDGVLLADQNTNIIAPGDGIYRVVATANGCTADTSAPYNYVANRVCSFATTFSVDTGRCPSVTFEVDGVAFPVTALISFTGQATPSTHVFNQFVTTLPDFCPSEYTITLSDANGCTDTLTFTILETGIAEANNNITLNIYPNPTLQTLALQSSEAVTGVAVYNIMGQQVLAMDGNITTVDVTTLPAGTYYINVNTIKGAARKPFVKL
ncbi:hypothetical protein BH09BAC1_BH09BAC1_19030 [soil metagenome]